MAHVNLSLPDPKGYNYCPMQTFGGNSNTNSEPRAQIHCTEGRVQLSKLQVFILIDVPKKETDQSPYYMPPGVNVHCYLLCNQACFVYIPSVAWEQVRVCKRRMSKAAELFYTSVGVRASEEVTDLILDVVVRHSTRPKHSGHMHCRIRLSEPGGARPFPA
ncbi:hypothetical protein ARMSODRAFT_1064628 [Armillaria solidipes]|uniref:Uncharacterized protein n=1 Tax=Armillaria solidipes TaxID=1076256 RepID=A0A2H3B633_9AGAR|nr:hypothetical protein ARMSODRAFT_1064628 [Armillaria solidipes]